MVRTKDNTNSNILLSSSYRPLFLYLRTCTHTYQPSETYRESIHPIFNVDLCRSERPRARTGSRSKTRMFICSFGSFGGIYFVFLTVFVVYTFFFSTWSFFVIRCYSCLSVLALLLLVLFKSYNETMLHQSNKGARSKSPRSVRKLSQSIKNVMPTNLR